MTARLARCASCLTFGPSRQGSLPCFALNFYALRCWLLTLWVGMNREGSVSPCPMSRSGSAAP
jgi:hypothetical protein